MAVARLVPSAYTRSSTNNSYCQVSDPDNMYNNTDHTANYATLRGRSGNNTAYYVFIHGFDFSSVPDDALVSSFAVKIRAYRSQYQSTGSTYRIRLASSASTTNVIADTTMSSDLTTSAAVYTIPTGNLTWSQIKDYGSNFSIEVPLRRSSGSNYPYVYVYGAEIEVTYTVPVYHSVTINNSTSANVTTSDSSPIEGSDVSISTNTVSGITIKDNGVDVTSQFTLVPSGSVSKTAASQTNTGISSGSQYASYAVGYTAENPHTASNNIYSASGTTGHIDYAFDFSDIPAGATISSVTIKANGHAESTTYTSGSRMAEIQAYSGTTAKGAAQHYTSTSNTTLTLSNVGTWTRDELQHAILRFTFANYGGLVCGITWSVSYESNGYVYTITNITQDHTIVVTASSGPSLSLYVKDNGTWKQAVKVLVKQNGNWQEASKVLVKDNGVWK